MQDIPDKATMLLGIARFLDQDLRPTIADGGTAFRVRIAAHLLAMVVRELVQEGTHDAAELRHLQALLDQSSEVPVDPGDRVQAILAARTALAASLKQGDVDTELAIDGLLSVLKDRISVSNPRFSFDQDVP
jgi:hypothetical protein